MSHAHGSTFGWLAGFGCCSTSHPDLIRHRRSHWTYAYLDLPSESCRTAGFTSSGGAGKPVVLGRCESAPR